MRSTNDENEFYQSLNPSTTLTAQGVGIDQDLHPNANLPILEASALANLVSEPECKVEMPDNKRIAQLSIGLGFITASVIFAIASFERESTVFITSIAMLSLLAGVGFVYLVVKAILAAEYDFEL